MKSKEERTVKKVINVKRKLTSLENVKMKAKELKELTVEVIVQKGRKRKNRKTVKSEKQSSTNSSKTISST